MQRVVENQSEPYIDVDCLFRILSYLSDQYQFLSLSTVCKRWRKIILLVPDLTIHFRLFKVNSSFDIGLYKNLRVLKMTSLPRYISQIKLNPKIEVQIRLITFLSRLPSEIHTLILGNNRYLRLAHILHYFKNLTSLHLLDFHHLSASMIAQIPNLKYIYFQDPGKSILDEFFLLDHVDLIEFNMAFGISPKRISFQRTGEVIIHGLFSNTFTSNTFKGKLVNGIFEGVVRNEFVIRALNVKILYEGELNERLERNGNGKYCYHDNHQILLEGQWKNGKMHGHGRQINENGDEYIGNFFAGDYHDHGVMMFKNGSRYEGNFGSGKMNGKGIFVCKNGIKYEGEFCNNKKHGKGLLTNLNGTQYSGFWVNNLLDGFVICNKYNGEIWRNMWRNDERNGKGCIIFNDKDNSVFKGTWVDNKITGRGKWFIDNNKPICRGTYSNGYFEKGEFLSKDEHFIYVGSFDHTTKIFTGSIYSLLDSDNKDEARKNVQQEVQRFCFYQME
jgi:hypothetical protein